MTVLFQSIRGFAILVERYARNKERLKPLANKTDIGTTLVNAARQGKTKAAEMLLDLCVSLFHDYVNIMEESQKLERRRTRARL